MSDGTPPERREDAFPDTRLSWIDRKLLEGEGGRAELARHIMEVYARPLKVYFLGSSFRRLGDAEDLVQGFFAERLASPRFLLRWKEEGRRLRYWLVQGFKYFLLETSRREARWRSTPVLPTDFPAGEDPDSPEAAMDRAFKQELVRKGLQQAEERCRSAGLEDHWKVFLHHTCQGHSYEPICSALGVSATRAVRMNQAAKAVFRDAIRDLLSRDGATPGEIDREIQGLLEAS